MDLVWYIPQLVIFSAGFPWNSSARLPASLEPRKNLPWPPGPRTGTTRPVGRGSTPWSTMVDSWGVSSGLWEYPIHLKILKGMLVAPEKIINQVCENRQFYTITLRTCSSWTFSDASGWLWLDPHICIGQAWSWGALFHGMAYTPGEEIHVVFWPIFTVTTVWMCMFGWGYYCQ